MDQYEWKDHLDSGPNHRKVVMRTRERAQTKKWGIVSLDWIEAKKAIVVGSEFWGCLFTEKTKFGRLCLSINLLFYV